MDSTVVEQVHDEEIHAYEEMVDVDFKDEIRDDWYQDDVTMKELEPRLVEKARKK